MKAELRSHPKMKWRNGSNWPPAWTGSSGFGDILPGGEDGILKSVEIEEKTNAWPRHLKLTIEHAGLTASGILCMDDEGLLPALRDFLDRHRGLLVRDIASMEIDL
jgi:hypothetical protein